MIYFSQAQVDALLLEDIQGGDLTTRALGIGAQPGNMGFYHRQGGCVSGTTVARQMLTSLGLTVTDLVPDGERARTGQLLLRAHGNAAALHQGWKAVQNVLEWSCGVSRYLDDMLSILRGRLPAPAKLSLAPVCWLPRRSLLPEALSTGAGAPKPFCCLQIIAAFLPIRKTGPRQSRNYAPMRKKKREW